MIELPWPPSSLSGHASGDWRKTAPIVAKHREWARLATLDAQVAAPEGDGDIFVLVTFYPPDKRSDRVNFPNRCKPYFDGIAEALKVNDRRFWPSYIFAEPVKGAGKIVVSIA
jgi:hypothetical protein